MSMRTTLGEHGAQFLILSCHWCCRTLLSAADIGVGTAYGDRIFRHNLQQEYLYGCLGTLGDAPRRHRSVLSMGPASINMAMMSTCSQAVAVTRTTSICHFFRKKPSTPKRRINSSAASEVSVVQQHHVEWGPFQWQRKALD